MEGVFSIAGAELDQAGDWECLGIPIEAGWGDSGLLAVFVPERAGIERETVESLKTLGSHAGIAVRHAEAVSRIRRGRTEMAALSRRLIRGLEDERRHLSNQLHERLGQDLTALRFAVDGALSTDGVATMISTAVRDEMMALTSRMIDDVRSRSLELRPSSLDQFGLAVTLKGYVSRRAERAGLEATVEIEPPHLRGSSEVETALFRVLQEAMTNVSMHSGASRVKVRLWERGGALRLAVTDNGDGFEPKPARGRERRGLDEMRDRIVLLGGRFRVRSRKGRGCLVWASVPTKASRSDEARRVPASAKWLGEDRTRPGLPGMAEVGARKRRRWRDGEGTVRVLLVEDNAGGQLAGAGGAGRSGAGAV